MKLFKTTDITKWTIELKEMTNGNGMSLFADKDSKVLFDPSVRYIFFPNK